MTAPSAIALLGCSLLAAWLVAAPLGRLVSGLRARAVLVVTVVAAAWLPIDGLPIAGYLRGVIGDPSMTTFVLLVSGLAAFTQGREFCSEREKTFGFGALAAAAVFLYPMALGLGRFDPYALGYAAHPGAAVFAVSLGTLGVAAWLARMHRIVGILCAAVLAHLAGAMESANLWDALLDPLAALYALAWLLRRSLVALRTAGRNTAHTSGRQSA